MHWHHLEAGQIGDLPLDLYEANGEFMIRVDGLELMNSHWHRSEMAMAELAGDKLEPYASRRAAILLGGLGLGYTLAAFIQKFGREVELTVAEKSADVLLWYQKYFRSKVIQPLDDSPVHFVKSDVQDLFNDKERFDLIVLDVDNGPEAISGRENQHLYTTEGLARMGRSLNPNGSIFIWSGFQSTLFESTARAAGYAVECRAIDVGHLHHQHFIYLLRFMA